MSKELTDERRRQALSLLHEFKDAPPQEKAAKRRRLDDYLDALREGTAVSRFDLLDVLHLYYPDYRAQQRRQAS